jgi:hypothetical protein
MEKVILSLMFVFATGTSFMNANSNSEISNVTNDFIEVAEDFGCRSECNSDARAGAIAMSEDQEDRSSEGELMRIYSEMYFRCITTRC